VTAIYRGRVPRAQDDDVGTAGVGKDITKESKRQSLHTLARLIYNTKVYLTPLWKLQAETPPLSRQLER